MAGQQKSLVGKVISDKMTNTVVVVVEHTTRHRLYHKILRRTKHYLVHDDRLEAKPGDVVRILETSPISRHKRWRVAEIVQAGEVADVAPREIDAEYIGRKRERAEPAAAKVTSETTPEADSSEAPVATEAEASDQEPDIEAGESETAEVAEIEPERTEQEAAEAQPEPAEEEATEADPKPEANAEEPSADDAMAADDVAEEQKDS